MKTIVEPNKRIDALWGKQQIKTTGVYRLMRYVFRVDYKDKVLLHNVVTGQLVVLDQKEIEITGELPVVYSPTMEQLVINHYLVPVDYEEHQQVVKLRMILQRLLNNQKSTAITSYTILPTTACNARCYYCFEQGVKPMTMTEETAKKVVDFVSSHCGEKKSVSIMWFGGEPTVATNRIDQICSGLREHDVQFYSLITTNGFLFDEELVLRAKTHWNLRGVSISVDGTEKTYNAIKAYVMASDNPYQRVMRNIGLLLEQEIDVRLRMNFDIGNCNEFQTLVEEVTERFHHNKYFHFRAHPVNGEYENKEGKLQHGDEGWFSEMLAQLNRMAYERGVYQEYPILPCMRFNGCGASNKAALIITPDGNLAKCPEEFTGDQIIGDLNQGIIHQDLADSWMTFANYERCRECSLFPYCERLERCAAKDRCTSKLDYSQRIHEGIVQKYNTYLRGGISDDV